MSGRVQRSGRANRVFQRVKVSDRSGGTGRHAQDAARQLATGADVEAGAD
jgi:hypothetical protein